MAQLLSSGESLMETPPLIPSPCWLVDSNVVLVPSQGSRLCWLASDLLSRNRGSSAEKATAVRTIRVESDSQLSTSTFLGEPLRPRERKPAAPRRRTSECHYQGQNLDLRASKQESLCDRTEVPLLCSL